MDHLRDSFCVECGRAFWPDFLHLDCTDQPGVAREVIDAEIAFRVYARASGQALCPDPGHPSLAGDVTMHELETALGLDCTACKAVV